jgi:hypothetical protein
MAKKKEEQKVEKTVGAHVKAKDSTGMVTVSQLAKDFDVDGRVIRMAIRAKGLRAPEVDREEGTFGPKAKYEWEPGSKELKVVEEAINEYLDEQEKKAAERKKNGGRTDAQLKADAKLKADTEARRAAKEKTEQVEEKAKDKKKK